MARTLAKGNCCGMRLDSEVISRGYKHHMHAELTKAVDDRNPALEDMHISAHSLATILETQPEESRINLRVIWHILPAGLYATTAKESAIFPRHPNNSGGPCFCHSLSFGISSPFSVGSTGQSSFMSGKTPRWCKSLGRWCMQCGVRAHKQQTLVRELSPTRASSN